MDRLRDIEVRKKDKQIFDGRGEGLIDPDYLM